MDAGVIVNPLTDVGEPRLRGFTVTPVPVGLDATTQFEPLVLVSLAVILGCTDDPVLGLITPVTVIDTTSPFGI